MQELVLKKKTSKVSKLAIGGMLLAAVFTTIPWLSSAYTVQAGDTLSSIAGSYEAALELAELNGIENPDLIYVGQEITLLDEMEDVAVDETISETAQNMIAKAKSLQGVPYVWGGYSTSGFDCSGFVAYVMNNCGNGWSVARGSANSLRSYCTKIDKSDLQPGDLIFFQGTYNTSGASHVGIYIGNGQMIHASSSQGVTITSINSTYWVSHYMESGRINLA